MTIVTQLQTGFINTVATNDKASETYYVNDDHTFRKGWMLMDESDWHFFAYDSGAMQASRWIADGKDNNQQAKWYCLDKEGVMLASKWIANNATGSKWYYVDENGLFLTNTIIDGYVINAEGYWSK